MNHYMICLDRLTDNGSWYKMTTDDNETEIIDRVIGMAKNKEVKSITGKIINLDINTICLHGDNKDSVILAKKLKKELINSGCEIKSLPTFIK